MPPPKRPVGAILSKHCGPGNDITDPDPGIDTICHDHDIKYGEYYDRNQDYSHYWSFSQADQEFINAAVAEGGVRANVVASIFEAKKYLTGGNGF